MKKFRIKICGIKQSEHARVAHESGADAIGLNFYERSLRSVTIDQAQSVCEALPESVARVGVFVNLAAEPINEIARAVQLDWVQLHGDEKPELIPEIECDVIRAVRVDPRAVLDSDSGELEAIESWIEAGAKKILLDARSPKGYGGTGETIDWDSVGKLKLSVPLILAGGLNQWNVAQAIRLAKPAGVDTASGVERFPAGKDPQMIRAFASNAVLAFDGRK